MPSSVVQNRAGGWDLLFRDGYLKLFLRNCGQLLPLRGLIAGNAQASAGLWSRTNRRHKLRALAARITPCAVLLRRFRQQFPALALSPHPDFSCMTFGGTAMELLNWSTYFRVVSAGRVKPRKTVGNRAEIDNLVLGNILPEIDPKSILYSNFPFPNFFVRE
jgi:hypothetical protein